MPGEKGWMEEDLGNVLEAWTPAPGKFGPSKMPDQNARPTLPRHRPGRHPRSYTCPSSSLPPTTPPPAPPPRCADVDPTGTNYSDNFSLENTSAMPKSSAPLRSTKKKLVGYGQILCHVVVPIGTCSDLEDSRARWKFVLTSQICDL